MVACTNDDVLENPVDNPVNGQEANTAYVSVKLVMTTEGGSRATTDGGYDVGTPAEQKIDGTKSIFLFYDENGKWVTSGTVATSEPATENSGTDHSDKVNDLSDAAYIVLSGPDQELKKSTQVLTVVNYHNCNSLKQLDKDEVLEIITKSTENKPEEGFLMSTSVYYNEGIVNTTAIDGTTQICATQEKALANPVKIYIERASAKVEAIYNASYEVEGDGEDEDETTGESNDTEGGDMIVDGTQMEAKVAITGWRINGVNEDTYLVKRIQEAWGTEATQPFTGWNFSNNFRSYWAEGTKYGLKVGETGLTYYSYNEATGTSATPQYCYEQTVSNQLTGVGQSLITDPNQTTILIKAEIQLPDEDGNYATAGNLYKYGGVFYTEDNYKTLIMKQLQGKYYTKSESSSENENGETITTTTEADLTTDDITLSIASDGTSLAGIAYSVAIAEGVTVYTKNENAEEEVEAGDIEEYINALAYVTEVEGYANGKCYYHIPIEHLSSVDGTPYYGVVRNHWYKLNISAVKHIGSPIYNPDKDINVIPEKDTTFYLAAELHVLSWHVVNQDVTLE